MDEQGHVTRYIVMAPSGRFIIFEDEEDVADWDEPVLEVEIPTVMAAMFDAVQRSWYGFQDYCEMIWEEVGRLKDLDGDQRALDSEFLNIVEALDINTEEE